MELDVDDLLKPVSGEDPAGADLSYEADRQRIESAFEGAISADGPQKVELDWREIIALIVAQSAQTKDLWLPVYLCRAGARAGRVEVIHAGAQYLAGLAEQYWETVHPRIADYGFQGRKATCESLTRFAEFLLPLRRAILLRHPRLGDYSGEDFERFAEGGVNEDGFGMFRAAIEESGEDLQQILDHLDGIRNGIRRTDAVLTASAEGDTATNFAPTYEAIDQLRRGIAAFTGGAEAETQGADEAPQGAAASGAGRLPTGRLDSREDVARSLDAIIDYYRRREPGSPVPVLLARAREWLNADFLAILEDMVPGGADDIKRILMSQRDR